MVGSMPKDSYKKLLEETRDYYKSLKKIRYQHIDNNFIVFSNSGFTHLLIKDRKSRPIGEQFRKLSLIRHIPHIINSDEVKKEVRLIPSKEYGQIKYLALLGKVDSNIVKIILRKLGSGDYHFWSIMDQ